jgi:hypothetical protein
MLTTVVLWVAWSVPVAIGVGLILRTRKKGVAEEAEAYLRALAGWSPADLVSRVGFGGVALAGVVALAGASMMAGPGLPDVDMEAMTRSVRHVMGVEQSDFRPAQAAASADGPMPDKDAKGGTTSGTADAVANDSALPAVTGDEMNVAAGGSLVDATYVPPPSTSTDRGADGKPTDAVAAGSRPTESKANDTSSAATVRPAASRPAAHPAPAASETASPAEPASPDPTPPASAVAEPSPPASTTTDAMVSRQVARTSVQMTNQSVEVSTTDTSTTQAG